MGLLTRNISFITIPLLLPVHQAHTCFNQLVLPPYTEKEVLKTKLRIAFENSEGFGLE